MSPGTRVSLYKMDNQNDEYISYIVFASGVIMYESEFQGWRKSHITREQIENNSCFEFIDIIEAPCAEQI